MIVLNDIRVSRSNNVYVLVDGKTYRMNKRTIENYGLRTVENIVIDLNKLYIFLG